MRNVIRRILLIICIVVFLFSGGKLAKYFWDNHQSEKEFKSLKTEFSLKDLKQQNGDLYGWIYIEDSNVNYPVMFTPKSPEFYLRKDFQKEYSINGTPFIDGYTDIENSQNKIIYGHHIKSGAMFQNITKYDDEGYWTEHPTVQFNTLKDGKKEYKVFAFGKTSAVAENFNVYDYINVTTPEAYDEYVRGLKALTQYDIGITPEYGQEIITLSTCEYHTEEGRYVLAAVRVK